MLVKIFSCTFDLWISICDVFVAHFASFFFHPMSLICSAGMLDLVHGMFFSHKIQNFDMGVDCLQLRLLPFLFFAVVAGLGPLTVCSQYATCAYRCSHVFVFFFVCAQPQYPLLLLVLRTYRNLVRFVHSRLWCRGA